MENLVAVDLRGTGMACGELEYYGEEGLERNSWGGGACSLPEWLSLDGVYEVGEIR